MNILRAAARTKDRLAHLLTWGPRVVVGALFVVITLQAVTIALLLARPPGFCA